MGQFKPMVKMETTEPSVILKLKKGGSVKGFKNTKMHTADSGHKKMAGGGSLSALLGSPALVGRPAVNAPVRSPGKPSMAERREAMMAKKGQKMPAKAKASERGMPEAAIKGVAPGGAPPGMKKGGKAEGGESPAMHKAEMKKMSKLEGELKSHEGKPASKAHKGLKTGGVVKGNGGGYKTGGVAKGNGGGYAAGGSPAMRFTTDKAPVRLKDPVPMRGFGTTTPTRMGTIKPTPYGNTMSMPKRRKTGGVVDGQGGFCEGGASKKGYATGGKVDSGHPVAMPQGNKKPSPPATQVNLSGVFKSGGKVKKKEANVAVLAKGGSAPQKGRTRPKKMAEGGDLLQNAKSASRSFLEKASAASQRTTGKALIPTAEEIAAKKAADQKAAQDAAKAAQAKKDAETARFLAASQKTQQAAVQRAASTPAAPYSTPSYMSYNTANKSNLSGSTYSPYSGTTVSNRYSQPQVVAYKPGMDMSAYLLSGNAPVMKATYRAKGGSTTKKPVKMAAGGSFLQKAITASNIEKANLDNSKLYPTTAQTSVPVDTSAPAPVSRSTTPVSYVIPKPAAPAYTPPKAPAPKPVPYNPNIGIRPGETPGQFQARLMGVKPVTNIYPSSSNLYGNYTPKKYWS